MSKDNKKDPQEDIRQLNSVIASGQFKNVHLLWGEEDYLRLQFRDKLLKAMGAEPGSMSCESVYGKDVSPEQIIDLAETLPFFSDHRIILLENTGWFKNGCEAMENYLDQGVCDTTFLVFCEKEIDKRTKIFKTASSKGMVSEFMTQDVNSLCSWAAGIIRKAGLEISGQDVRHLIDMVGTDMVSVSNELDKLVAYCLDKSRITAADINAVCSRKLEDKVFDMVDALAVRKKTRALGMYYDLMELRESPIKVLVLVTRQYELLLKIKDMELGRHGDNEIGQAVGRPGWTIRNYRAQTSGYSIHELKKIVAMCADTDMSIKTGRIAEQIAVETLLVKLSDGIFD